MLIWLLTYNKAINILGGTVFEFLIKVNNSRKRIFLYLFSLVELFGVFKR